MEFDAIVVDDGSSNGARVLGLSLAERGLRVARRSGARRILLIGKQADDTARTWLQDLGDAALLVLDVSGQVVHTPLVQTLRAGHGARRVAVDGGEYAGALWAEGAAARELADAIVAGNPAHAATAAAWLGDGADAITPGPISRHAARTAQERRGATQMLLHLIVKSQDSPITRYLYRPVSKRITRVLVTTPITPNQISIVVGLLGLVGCWFVAQASQASLLLGMGLILISGFLDGCDGEIARLRLEYSALGEWIDTIADEATTTACLVALGVHCVRNESFSWLPASIWIGAIAYVFTVYAIYFYLIVVSKTGNSQHYVGRLEIVHGLGLRPMPPRPLPLPAWLVRAFAFAPDIIRRDFINLGSFALALVNGYLLNYAIMLVGGVVTALVLAPEHIRLRRQLRALHRAGVTPRLLPRS